MITAAVQGAAPPETRERLFRVEAEYLVVVGNCLVVVVLAVIGKTPLGKRISQLRARADGLREIRDRLVEPAFLGVGKSPVISGPWHRSGQGGTLTV